VGDSVLSREQQLAIERSTEVDPPAVRPAVDVDPDRASVREVRVLEQLAQLLDVGRKPEVVVGEVADELAPGLRQCLVAVDLAVARALRVVEEADTLVRSSQLCHHLARGGRDAVSDDEHLDLLDRLGEGARH
jgi:hypothetical protein